MDVKSLSWKEGCKGVAVARRHDIVPRSASERQGKVTRGFVINKTKFHTKPVVCTSRVSGLYIPSVRGS
jgi:hypothetical protein